MFHELRINTARQERYFSMTFVRSHSLRLIKELCLISFIFQRTGCTRRSSTERGETQTIFITYATDSEFQYLNYNLRGEMNEKKKLQNEVCGSLSGWNCTFYLRIASYFADIRENRKLCTLLFRCDPNARDGERRIGHKLKMQNATQIAT